MEIFKKVLNDKKPVEGVNHGFQLKNNKIFTYEQRRNGFTYFYCKRKVCEDGIHTEPLDIVLNPRPEETKSDFSDGTSLSIEYLLAYNLLDDKI